jgi:hypothetical protein
MHSARAAHACSVGLAHGLGRAARAAHGGAARRASDDTVPAHGRRRGRWLTGVETATGDGGTREAAVGTRREGEAALSGGRAARGCRAGERRRGSCRGARRAVPTVALSRCIGAARGGHAAAAQRDTAVKRCPLVSDF